MATSMNYKMEVEDSEFCCPLCFEIFDEPKSFPTCVHTLCKACLVELVARNDDSKDVECPMCRQTSPLSPRGVDGFPTNTFIVRLMEKIPGMKEKREITQAVTRCKGEIERNKKIHVNIEKQLDLVKKNKQLGEDLKKEISSHAKDYVEAIKKCEEKMCKDVDEFVKETCSAQFQRELEREYDHLASYLEVAQNCVLNVEDMIKQEDLSEIPPMKEVIQEQLKEYSRYPAPFFIEDAANIKTFDMVFEKSEIKTDVLGKAFSKEMKPSAAAPVSTHAPSTSTSNLNSRFSQISMQDTPNLPWREDTVEESSRDSEVLHSVDLSFCPNRIAVCGNNVALLCKERRKVYLYNSHAEMKQIVQIKYGNLTDVGFLSGEVVVVNRENNRLLFYDTHGLFSPKKFQTPPQNVKFTYLSVEGGNRITVVSTLSDDESNVDDIADDEITKCVVVYEPSGRISKIFGRSQLEHPVSRAIFHTGNSKFFVADLISEAQEIAVKTFTSDFTIAEIIVTENMHRFNIGSPFVSLYHDEDTGFDPELKTHSSLLLMGCPGRDFLFVIDESGECVGRRFTHVAKQQEWIPAECVALSHDFTDGDVIQVEIYPSQKLFKIVGYHPPSRWY